MPTFSNFADIEKFVKKELPTILIANNIEDEFYRTLCEKYKEFVNMFYSEYPENIYPRTNQLRDLLPCKIVPHTENGITTYGIDLGSNIKNLSHSHWTNKGFSSYHYGNEGDEFAERVVAWALLEGSHGGWIETDTAPLEELDKWVEQNIGVFVKILKDALSKNGMFIVK